MARTKAIALAAFCLAAGSADAAGTVVEAEGLKYFESPLPADAVRAAFAGSRASPLPQ